MPHIMRNNIKYAGGASSNTPSAAAAAITISQEDFDKLTEEEKVNGIYVIPDGEDLTAKNLFYDGSETGLGNTVQDAIDNQNKNLNMRYNEETDMVEIFYNGVWNAWKFNVLQKMIERIKNVTVNTGNNQYLYEQYSGGNTIATSRNFTAEDALKTVIFELVSMTYVSSGSGTIKALKDIYYSTTKDMDKKSYLAAGGTISIHYQTAFDYYFCEAN